MVTNVVLDVRSLQDGHYRDRGVGRLGANLLESARRVISQSKLNIIGLVDPALPQLEQRFRVHLDETRSHSYVQTDGSCWFIELSPMTHDPLFVARFLDSAHAFKGAIVYDFIPQSAPERYLPKLADKIDYHVKLQWLRRYDHFFPISHHTNAELRRNLGIAEERATVSAPPIDSAFLKCASGEPRLTGHVLCAGGGDSRKNVECAIRAHARSGVSAPLLITGVYPVSWKEKFCQLHAAAGGRPRRLPPARGERIRRLRHRPFVDVHLGGDRHGRRSAARAA